MIKKNFLIRKDSTIILLSCSLLYFILTFLILPDYAPFLKYPLLAKQYLNGTLDMSRITDLSPIYFYFNILIMYFFKSISLSVNVIRVIHIVLLSFSTLFIFKTFKMFFSKLLSAVGIIFFTFNYTLIVYTKVIEPEIFMIFFLSGFIYYINKQDICIRDILIAGIFFAFGVLTRSNFLPIVIILPIYLWFKKTGKKKWIKNVIVLIIPILLSILFLIVRNYYINGEFSPYAADPGYVFFEGNNPNSSGQSAVYPPLINNIAYEYPKKPDYQHKIYSMFAKKITGKNLSVIETNDFWSKKAKNYIIDYPLVFIERISKKIQYFFHNYRRHDLENAYKYDFAIKNSPFPVFPFWIISLFALIGILISIHKWKKNFIFLAIFFMQFIVLTLIYVSERQRLAILPIFIFFSLYTIDYFLKNRKYIIYLLFLIGASYFFLSVKTDLMYEEDYIWQTTNKSYNNWIEAKIQRKAFNTRLSEKNIYNALKNTPWMFNERHLAYIPYKLNNICKNINHEKLTSNNFSRQFSNAILLIEAKKLKKAEKILLQLFKKDYHFKRDFFISSQPLYYLGIIEEKRKNYNKAILYFNNALAINPGSPFSLSHMYALTGQEKYKDKIIRYFDKIDACFFIGKALLEIGKPQIAKNYFKVVIDYFPNYRDGLIYYAVTLGRLKNYRSAVFFYLQALKRRLDPIYFEKDILSIFKNWVKQENNNPISIYYYGQVLGQFGHYTQSIELLNKALLSSDKNNKLIIEKELIKMRKLLKNYKNGEMR